MFVAQSLLEGWVPLAGPLEPESDHVSLAGSARSSSNARTTGDLAKSAVRKAS